MRILWIPFLIVIIDQVTKVIARTNMHPVRSIPIVGDWLKLTYTQNPGMAFGINVGPAGLITIFSIVATILIAFYLVRIRKGYLPYVLGLTMIFGGAIGNIIDRVFYGVIFDYAPLFQGKVVDFIHVDLGYFSVPPGVPGIGGIGMHLLPIWNVADMAIVGGVIGVLLFQNRFHDQQIERAVEAERAEAERAEAERAEAAQAMEADAAAPPPEPPAGEVVDAPAYAPEPTPRPAPHEAPTEGTDEGLRRPEV